MKARLSILMLISMIIAGCVTDEDYLVDGISVVFFSQTDLVPMVATNENGDLLAPYTASANGMNAAVWIPSTGHTLTVWNDWDASARPGIAKYGDNVFVFSNWTSTTVDLAVLDASLNITTYQNVSHNIGSLGIYVGLYLYEGLNNAADLVLAAACVISATAHTTGSSMPCADAFLAAAAGLILDDETGLEDSDGVFDTFASLTGTAAAEFVATEYTSAKTIIDAGAMYATLAEGLLDAEGGDIQVIVAWNEDTDWDLYVTDPSGDRLYYSNSTVASGGVFVVDSFGYGPETVYWPSGTAPTGEFIVEIEPSFTATTLGYALYVKNKNEFKIYTGTGTTDTMMEILRFWDTGTLPQALLNKVGVPGPNLIKVRISADQ